MLLDRLRLLCELSCNPERLVLQLNCFLDGHRYKASFHRANVPERAW
jgi:hypothetical protein